MPDAQIAPEVQTLLALLYQHSNRRLEEVRRHGRKFAHYTTAENALNIIGGRSIWLRNAAVMNDHSELEHGRVILTTLLEAPLGVRLCAALDRTHDGISNTIRASFYQDAHSARDMTYMTSLCEHEHTDWLGRLSMWRAYGGERGGVALVFNPDVITDPTVSLGLYPSPVLYGDATDVSVELTKVVESLEQHPEIIAAVDEWTAALVVAGALHFAMLSAKHRGFEEEREWRILCLVRDLPPQPVVKPIIRAVSGIPQTIYQVPFHGHEGTFLPQFTWDNLLDRIIVGPSLYPEIVKQAIEAELKSQGVARWDQLVNVSDTPLRQPG